MSTSPTDTPATKIERWQALKGHIEAQTKAFSDYVKQFKEEQDQIEAWLLDFLNKSGQDSSKTQHGTAYKSTTTSPKIDDREKYLDWVLEKWDERGAMLQIGTPQVGEFKAHMEYRKKEIEVHVANTGQLPPDSSVTPPGTSFTTFTKVNIRKS
jgi:hypothetical protein